MREKKEKRDVSFAHEQNIVQFAAKKRDDITYEQTIICRHLFAGHVVGSRPRKRKKTSHRMIISDILMPRMQSVKVNMALSE